MHAPPSRQLLVIADDFGMGPNTTAGILQLASRGLITGATLLVNAPTAPDAVRQWRQQGATLDLGWHPNLTLDAPIAPTSQVASLVKADGKFRTLGALLRRWLLGLLDPREIHHELEAQLQRFLALVGQPPLFVACHHHINLFAPIGEILLHVLSSLRTRPYVRRIQEPWPVVATLAGARLKRTLLNWLGRRLSRLQEAHGFPGNDWLAGITSPACLQNADFFTQWLRVMPGRVVELVCHPGRLDPSLRGRDGHADEAWLHQRVHELRWLREPSFLQAVDDAGFRLISPAELVIRPTSLDSKRAA